MSVQQSQLRNENLIPENVPVIFLERPWTVLKLSMNEKIGFCQRMKLVARCILVLFRSIVTWELTMHTGFFLKQEGKIYRYHMTGTKALKQDVTKHYLHGCHWLIPNEKQILDAVKKSKMDLNMPNATDQENLTYAYNAVIHFMTESCVVGCKYSNAELLSMPFYRSRVKSKMGYIEQYRGHKLINRFAKSPPNFICTEYVATAWARAGVQIAPATIRIEKTFMWDIQRYSTKHNLFTLYSAS